MRTLLVTVVCGLLVSCGGSGGGGSGSGGTGSGGTGGEGGTTTGTAASGATSGSTSGISVRVVNTFLPSGTTGPTLDIYDNLSLGQSASAKPIIAGLAYGAVSKYVTPHYEAPSATVVSLTALPAGSSPTDTVDAVAIFGAMDNSSHEQVTVLLTATRSDAAGSTAPLAGLSHSGYVEKGSDANDGSGPLAPAPPSGQGEFLVSTNPIKATTVGSGPGYYFFIDDSCTSALNGDTALAGVPYIFAVDGEAPVSGFALFASSPGSHTISVVAWASSEAPTCPQLTPMQGATTQSVTAGQQILAFVYGSSGTDVHLALAPIAP